MFKENYIITGQIVCETGLHIGGSTDSIEIGGSDNPVIRDSVTKLPFIPGSSLKGKLRSLLELYDPDSAKNVISGRNSGDPSDDDSVLAAQIFGISSNDHKNQDFPTRIIVRDSFPNQKTVDLWNEKEEVVAGAEYKYENQINRINSRANPRNIERVPKGSEFDFEIVFSVYEGDSKELIKGVFQSMLLLEDNYLGGSGSRGFGKVKFENISVEKRDASYYKEVKEADKIIENGTIAEAIAVLQ